MMKDGQRSDLYQLIIHDKIVRIPAKHHGLISKKRFIMSIGLLYIREPQLHPLTDLKEIGA